MSSYGDRPGQGRQEDVLKFGRHRPARGRWRSKALLVCLVLVTVLVVALRVTAIGPAANRGQLATGSRPPPVRVVLIGHRLLGVTAGWQLFARGPDDLLRIQLAQGRITWTYVPPLETASPAVAFVIEPHEAVIQPADIVPGYAVPDGGQARLLTGPLSAGGPVVPGPAGTQAVWVMAGPFTVPRLSLTTLNGHRAGLGISFPPGGPPVPATAVSDGRGGVLLTASNYIDYDAGPGWDRSVPGTVIAVGPGIWLTVVCNTAYQDCRYDVVNAVTGAGRVLPGKEAESPFYFTWPPAGVIAPGGATAALALPGRGGAMTVHLLNLRTGAVKDLGLRLYESSGNPAEDSMVWSPDNRWLFVAAADGKLVAINARSDRAESLGTPLPPVDQVAIRS
jgi:hypothetical protein